MPRPCACGCGLPVKYAGQYVPECVDLIGGGYLPGHDSITDNYREWLKGKIKEAKINWFPQT